MKSIVKKLVTTTGTVALIAAPASTQAAAAQGVTHSDAPVPGTCGEPAAQSPAPAHSPTPTPTPTPTPPPRFQDYIVTGIRR